MPIEELQEPYWEKQEGETPNQYCYFLEFLEFPTFNLKDFHDHLCELHKNSQKFTKTVAQKTEKNPFTSKTTQMRDWNKIQWIIGLECWSENLLDFYTDLLLLDKAIFEYVVQNIFWPQSNILDSSNQKNFFGPWRFWDVFQPRFQKKSA